MAFESGLSSFLTTRTVAGETCPGRSCARNGMTSTPNTATIVSGSRSRINTFRMSGINPSAQVHYRQRSENLKVCGSHQIGDYGGPSLDVRGITLLWNEAE